jgi:hypothetical protein
MTQDEKDLLVIEDLIEASLFSLVNVTVDGAPKEVMDITVTLTNLDDPSPVMLAYEDIMEKHNSREAILDIFRIKRFDDFILSYELHNVVEGDQSSLVLTFSMIVFHYDLDAFLAALSGARLEGSLPESHDYHQQAE